MEVRGAAETRGLTVAGLRGWIGLSVWVLAIVFALLFAVVAVFVGYRIASADEIVAGVTVAGHDVSGFGESDLDQLMRALQGGLDVVPLTVAAPGYSLETTTRAAGVYIDADAVKSEAMSIGRTGSVFDQFSSWLAGFREDRQVDLMYAVDPNAMDALVDWDEGRIVREPVEPAFTGTTGGFEVQDAIDGAVVEAGDVVAALEGAVAAGPPPYALTVESTVVPTQVSQAQLESALAEAKALTRRIPAKVGDRIAFISADVVRSWIDGSTTDSGLVPLFDSERVEPGIESLLADLADPLPDPIFDIVDGEVQYTLGEPARMCCGPGVTDIVRKTAERGGIADLPTKLVEEDGGIGRVEAMGVEEVIGEFTTRHACCESRVTNIHRIADLVRGQVIDPGERFSVNEFVGPRTRAKGFVSAGVIERGHFTEDVGGGISQFATTMFNASFFAGLDFDSYQSHSIYISRYPYGREATLNFPQPDLAVVNNTPYSMLVWTSYTSASITVQLYSTPYFEVEQTGQQSGRVSRCTRVNTFRQRTAPDGSVIDDAVFATYRPGEGLDCNGNPIPVPGG